MSKNAPMPDRMKAVEEAMMAMSKLLVSLNEQLQTDRSSNEERLQALEDRAHDLESMGGSQ